MWRRRAAGLPGHDADSWQSHFKQRLAAAPRHQPAHQVHHTYWHTSHPIFCSPTRQLGQRRPPRLIHPLPSFDFLATVFFFSRALAIRLGRDNGPLLPWLPEQSRDSFLSSLFPRPPLLILYCPGSPMTIPLSSAAAQTTTARGIVSTSLCSCPPPFRNCPSSTESTLNGRHFFVSLR